MSFHLGSQPGSFDLFTLIFKDFLKLDDCVGTQQYGCVTGNLETDVVFNLLLPHIVLILFLWLFSLNVSQGHRGIDILLGVGGYIFIVYQGWYALVSQFIIYWIGGVIFLGLFHFIFGRFFSPGRAEGWFKFGVAMAQKSKEKNEALRSLSEWKTKTKARLDKVRRELATTTDPNQTKALKEKELQLEQELDYIDLKVSEIRRG